MDPWSRAVVERQAPSLARRALSVLILVAGVCLVPSYSWAQTRAYQMTLLGSADAQQNPRPPTISYNVGVDIPTFYLGRENEPANQPIILSLPPSSDLTPYALIDWARVVAVNVDEVYYGPLKAAGFPNCLTGNGAAIVQSITNTLQTMATAVRARAPKARFWLNFHYEEVEWMRDSACPFNHDFIDVVSVDRYDIGFDTITGPRFTVPGVVEYYNYLSTHRPPTAPYQQLALVPGTITASYQSDSAGAAKLPEYVAYAQSQNQACTLPLGPTGVTGFYDGCPVWIVAGFSGGALVFTEEDGSVFYPIEHSNTQQIRAAWEQTLAIPRNPPSPSLARFNRQWVPGALKLLLN